MGRNRLRRILLPALALAVLNSCGDGGGTTTEPEPGRISVTGGSARAGGLLSVRAHDIALVQSEYEAELGGAALRLVAMPDSQLVGVVPELAAGTYEIAVTIGGRRLATNVTVLAAVPIANPVAYVNDALDEAVASYPDAPPGPDSDEWLAEREGFLQSVEEARAAMASATPDEQLAAARLLNEVRAALGPLASRGRIAAGAHSAAMAADMSCSEAATAAVISGLAYYAGIGVVVAGAVVPGVSVFVVLPGVLLVREALPAVEKDLQTMFAICGQQTLVGLTTTRFDGGPGASASLPRGLAAGPDAITIALPGVEHAAAITSASASSRFEFVRGVARPAWPVEEVRGFSASDIEDEGVKRLADAMDWVHEQVAGLPAWVRNRLPKLPSRPSQQEGEVVVREAAPATVRIENVTGGVTLDVATADDRLLLTANAAGSDSIPFTFDVVSTTDDDVRQTMSGVVLAHSGLLIYAASDSVKGTIIRLSDNSTSVLQCEFEYFFRIAGVEQITLLSFSSRRVTYSSIHPGGNVYEYTQPAAGTHTPGTYSTGRFDVESFYSDPHVVHYFTETYSYEWRNDATGETHRTNDLTLTCHP